VKLRDLVPEAPIDASQRAIGISGVTADSRKVRPGFLFFAIAGAKADGAHFAKQAAAAGALAVAAEHRPEGLPESVGFVPVKKPRLLILVSVQEPRTAIFGGTVAAPAFADIAKFDLQYLNIPPDQPVTKTP